MPIAVEPSCKLEPLLTFALSNELSYLCGSPLWDFPKLYIRLNFDMKRFHFGEQKTHYRNLPYWVEITGIRGPCSGHVKEKANRKGKETEAGFSNWFRSSLICQGKKQTQISKHSVLIERHQNEKLPLSTEAKRWPFWLSLIEQDITAAKMVENPAENDFQVLRISDKVILET